MHVTFRDLQEFLSQGLTRSRAPMTIDMIFTLRHFRSPRRKRFQSPRRSRRTRAERLATQADTSEVKLAKIQNLRSWLFSTFSVFSPLTITLVSKWADHVYYQAWSYHYDHHYHPPHHNHYCYYFFRFFYRFSLFLSLCNKAKSITSDKRDSASSVLIFPLFWSFTKG